MAPRNEPTVLPPPPVLESAFNAAASPTSTVEPEVMLLICAVQRHFFLYVGWLHSLFVLALRVACSHLCHLLRLLCSYPLFVLVVISLFAIFCPSGSSLLLFLLAYLGSFSLSHSVNVDWRAGNLKSRDFISLRLYGRVNQWPGQP